MTAPQSIDSYSGEESLQMMAPSRLSQNIPTHATAATNVTLKNPTRIVNNTAGAGYITYTLVDDAAAITEYFTAGNEKWRRVTSIGSTAQGTTIATVLVLEG